MIIHDEQNQSPGTRKSWPPSNRSTQEQFTPLPSKLISGCPLQPGDTLLDGENPCHNDDHDNDNHENDNHDNDNHDNDNHDKDNHDND